MLVSKKAVKATLVLSLTAFLAIACMLTQSASSAFTASVNNTVNAAGSGTTFLTNSNGTVQCTSVPSGSVIPATTNFPCAGSQFPATVATTGNTVGSELLTASGTANFASVNYDATACGPIQLANTATATNPLIPRQTVVYAQTGPTALTGSGATGFNGTNTMAVGTVLTAGIQDFTIGIWFKTSVIGGALIEFGTSSSDVGSSQYDRHLYFDSAGRVVFGVYPGGVQTLVSPAAYNDGNWHYAVASLKSAVTSTTARKRLYIDGALVANQTSTVAAPGNGAEVYNGYWRVGHGKTTAADGWTGTGQFFNGSLSNATVFPTELSAAQITGLYTAGSQTVFDANVSAAGATNYWKLGDNGQQTFAGPYPVIGAVSPCEHVRATVGTSGKCLHPVSATACPAVSSTYSLATLAAAAATPVTVPVVGTPQTITTTLARDTDYNTGYDVGLNILVPVTITTTKFDQTFPWASNKVII
jgi:Concanavalin A-like lectin/glucanases superfamily